MKIYEITHKSSCQATFSSGAGLTPIQLFLDEEHVRAWPGGVGDCKVSSSALIPN